MKYLFVEQNKLPKVCETNDIYQVIKDMFGNDYMTLNEDDSRLCMSMISKSKYTGLRELINNIDVLVDGRFELKNKKEELKFKGSSNQRTIDVKRSLNSREIIVLE